MTQHSEGHTHTHDPETMKKIIHRLSRAGGHLDAVKQMIADGRDCSEVLVQLAAVRAAIDNAGKELLKEHISHCIVHAVEEGDHQAIEDLEYAIDKYMK